MKISHKLIAGFLGSCLLLGGLGISFLQTNAKTRRRTNNIATNVDRELNVSNTLTNSVHQIQFDIQELIFADDELGSSLNLKEIEKKVRDNLDKIETAIAIGKEASFEETETDILIDRKTESDGIGIINKIDGKFEIYQDHVNSLMLLIAKAEKDKAIAFWLEDIKNISEKEIIDLIEEYQKDASEDIAEFKAKIDQQEEQSAQTIRMYLLFSALMSVGLYLYIYRSIYAPLTQLKDLMTCQSLNTNKSIEIDKNKDEFEKIADTLKYLTKKLSAKEEKISNLNEIIDAVEDSIIILNSNQNITKVNCATVKILGYNREELIGKNISLFLTEKNDLSRRSGEATYLTKTKETISITYSLANISGAIAFDDETTIWMAKNVTRQERSERKLADLQTKYTLAGRASALWEWDANKNKLSYSPAWKAMLGYEDSELEMSLEGWLNLIHPDSLEAFKQKFNAALNDTNHPLEITYQIKHKNGNYRTVICRGLAERNREEKIVRLVGSQIDITQRKLIAAKLEYETWYDRLTRLPNRTFLTQQLQALLDNAIELTQKDKNYLFGAILVDIDRFKTVKNAMGYLAGEKLLVDLTARFKELVPDCKIARFEEDKFAIVVENMTNEREIINFAGKIRAKLAAPFDLDDDLVYVTASVGIALNTKYYDRAEDMFVDAEIALNEAKRSDRSSCILFEPEMKLKLLKRAGIERDLQLAIEQEKLDIFYKPILAINNKEMIGLEAVIRWCDRTKGEIAPSDFIPIAEETGSILPLSWWVMEKVCWQMSQWQKEHSDSLDLFVSVDVYSSQFLEEDFVIKVSRILDKTGLHPSKLKLEINTETITKDFDLALQKIQKLKALDVGVYVDNFARDYSTLVDLKKLPVDTFKLDRSLADNIENDPDKFEVLQTVINLIANQNIDAIVQGVDKIKQTDLLKQLNCEYAQGSFFSGLLTNEVAEALIAARKTAKTN